MVRSWSTQDGLPHSTIYAIAQTRDGYLWVGTSGGLARFDGVRFRTYGLQDGLQAVRISSLLEDSRGRLWVGTSAGLSRWENGRFVTLTRADGLVNEAVSALAEGSDQSIWIGTEQGLQNWRNGVFTNVPTTSGEPARHVRALQRDSAGIIWASSMLLGLCRVDGNRLVAVSGEKPLPGTVYSLLVDRAEKLWAGSGGGILWQLSNGAWQRQGPSEGLPVANIVCMARGAEGPLWLGTQSAGLWCWDGSRMQRLTKVDGLSDDSICALLVDREGTVWAGTSSGGLNRLSRRFIHHWTPVQAPETPAVTSVVEDTTGGIWAATRNGGAFRLRDGRLEPFSDPAMNGARPYLYTATLTRDGSVWMAGESCIFRFRQGQPTLAFKQAPVRNEAIRAMCEDGDVLWLGTYSSTLMKVQDEAVSVVLPRGSFSSDITALVRESPGTLWIGTHNGLHLWNPDATRTWGTADGLISAAVRALHRDPDGTLWIGTEGGGLARLKDGRISCITTRHGLREDIVNQIVADDRGRLWLAGNRGLTRVSRRELADLADGKAGYLHTVSFGRNEGVACEQFGGGHSPTGLMARDGRLFLPTLRGIVEIEPHAEPVPLAAPRVRIEEVLVDGNVQAQTKALVLPPGSRKLEVSYSSLSLLASDGVQFRVKLEGLDGDWVDMGVTRTAGYNHVPPGRYTLQVAACDSGGNWNPDVASLAVVVRPHYWQTTWFKAVLAAVAAGVAGLAWQRHAAALRRRRTLQEAFTRQLIVGQESERRRVALELHDGLGQDLMLIKNRLAMAAGRAQEAPEIARQLAEISETTSHAIAEIRTISHGLRPAALEQAGLTHAIEWMAQQVSESSGIRISAELDNIDRLLSAEAEINFYRIVQEGLNNIVRHSQATEAIVTIKREADTLATSVFDNGRGFDLARPDAAQDGRPRFGLIGMTERAKLLGGHIEMQSAPGRGTRMSLTLPVPPRKE